MCICVMKVIINNVKKLFIASIYNLHVEMSFFNLFVLIFDTFFYQIGEINLIRKYRVILGVRN